MSLASTRSWLKASALIVILAGLVYTIGAVPPLSGLAALPTDFALWPVDGQQTLAGEEARLLCGVLGAVMAGWGVMLWLVADRLYLRDPELARLMILMGVGTWFVLDCAASLVVGAPLNLLINVAFLALFVIPLLRGANRS